MSMGSILGVLWRHKWLMLAIIFVTMLAVPLRLMTAQGEFTGTVKLLVTVPEQTQVDLLSGSVRPSTTADEINLARNNFVDVLKSDETHRRVIQALNLPAALQDYKLSVKISRETDFLTVQITTIDSQWAAQIANEHVAQARQYFGEVRAQPAALAKLALAAQVSEAKTQLDKAEHELVDFKNQYNISTIDAEESLANTVLARLYDQRYQAELAASGSTLTQGFPELLRSLDSQRAAADGRNDRLKAQALDTVIAFVSGQIRAFTQDTSGLSAEDRMKGMIDQVEAERAAAAAAGSPTLSQSYAYVVAYYSGHLLSIQQATTNLSVTNQLIADAQGKIANLNELTPQYNERQVRVDQARSSFKTLSDAYQEAVIKEDTARRADFIQVVLPATVQTRADTSAAVSLITLALVAAFGAAITLAFVAELIGRWLWPAAPARSQVTVVEHRRG